MLTTASGEMLFNSHRIFSGRALDAAAKSKRNGLMAVFECMSDKILLIDEERGIVRINMSQGQIRGLWVIPDDDELATPASTDYLARDKADGRLSAESQTSSLSALVIF